MIEGFLFAMILSFGVSISENQNQQTNYGYFQEDYWEQNDVASMDWNHPLREAPMGGVIPNCHLMDKMYEFRNEENNKGRYFPPNNKEIQPQEEDKKEEEKPLIIAGIK